MMIIDIANTFKNIFGHIHTLQSIRQQCVISLVKYVLKAMFIAQRAAQWFVEGQTSGSL